MKDTSWIERNKEKPTVRHFAMPRCKCCGNRIKGDPGFGYCEDCKDEINNDLDHYVGLWEE